MAGAMDRKKRRIQKRGMMAGKRRMSSSLLDGKVIVTTGDITKQEVDIVVNAANSSLMGGGGVDGAIHARGGPSILDECKKIRSTAYPDGLPTGEAVETTAGNMPAQWVVHTVGPVWKGGGNNEDGLLANCYQNSLDIAFRLGAQTIAFPAISTGVYGFPKPRAAGISYTAVEEKIREKDDITVYFVFFSQGDMDVFLENIEFFKKKSLKILIHSIQ
jgi:O-acetyl-ADP-ribose deacetylase (regulator of RNase III)